MPETQRTFVTDACMKKRSQPTPPNMRSPNLPRNSIHSLNADTGGPRPCPDSADDESNGSSEPSLLLPRSWFPQTRRTNVVPRRGVRVVQLRVFGERQRPPQGFVSGLPDLLPEMWPLLQQTTRTSWKLNSRSPRPDEINNKNGPKGLKRSLLYGSTLS